MPSLSEEEWWRKRQWWQAGKRKGASTGKNTREKAKKFSSKALKKLVDCKVVAIMAKPKGDNSSDNKEEVEMNDKRDTSHQMCQKLAKKSGKRK